MSRHYTRIDDFDDDKVRSIAEHIQAIIENLVEDAQYEGLKKTPERTAKSLLFCTQGYAQNPVEIIKSARFKEATRRQMVVVKDIEFYSICEHHLLPFFGKAHVAYIPDGYITGLSKVVRAVEAFSRRLQVQERLTEQIRDCIEEALHPLGVAVIIEALHTCMQMRGVENQHSVTTTSAFSGAFLFDNANRRDKSREEFWHIIGAKLH